MTDLLKELADQKVKAEKKLQEVTHHKTKVEGDLSKQLDAKKEAELRASAAELDAEIAFYGRVGKDLGAIIEALGKAPPGSNVADE